MILVARLAVVKAGPRYWPTNFVNSADDQPQDG